MDIYDSRYFIINKKFLGYLGLWPFDTSRKNHFSTAYFLILMFLGISSQIHTVMANSSNLDRVMESLIYILVASTAVLKVINFALAQKNLRVTFESIATNWQAIVDKQEKQILRKYSENGRGLVIVWAIIFGITASGVVFGPLIAFFFNLTKPKSVRSYPYVLSGEYWMENRDDYYLNIWCFEALLTFSVSFMFVATDTAFIVSIYHCLGLFAIVRHRIEILQPLVVVSTTMKTKSDLCKDIIIKNTKSTHIDIIPKLKQDLFYENILDMIRLHQNALKFAELLEETYKIWFLFVLAFTVLGFPLCCIEIAVYYKKPVQLIRFGGIFVCLAVHLLIFCWPGQQLIDLSSGLVDRSYMNDQWLTSSPKSKKSLLLHMLRSSNPCKVTAGGLVTMNFENFLAIMKTAFSCMMVLRSFRHIEVI